MCVTLLRFLLFNCISNFNCYFIHMYIVRPYCFFTLICGICSSVISLCNCAISFVLLYCYIVTLYSALSLVTIKGYLLACLIYCFCLSFSSDLSRPFGENEVN